MGQLADRNVPNLIKKKKKKETDWWLEQSCESLSLQLAEFVPRVSVHLHMKKKLMWLNILVTCFGSFFFFFWTMLFSVTV